jgi:hypothetical protein
MALGAGVWRVVKGSGGGLYCKLRIFLYWIAKVGGNSAIRFRRWLQQRGQKKSLVKLGEAVYQLHLEGKAGWSDDVGAKEIIQELVAYHRKRGNLEVRLQEREQRYRIQVKIASEAQSPRLTEGKGESSSDTGQ